MLVLYRFSARWTRTETIDGIFAAEEADVQAAVGIQGYLDEPLGRHSSGAFTLKPAHLTEVTRDQDFIAMAQEYGLLPAGINPLHALKCEGRCGDILKAPYQACHHEHCGWKR